MVPGNINKQMPKMFRPIGLELVNAIKEAGFEVLSHAMEWREVFIYTILCHDHYLVSVILLYEESIYNILQ